MSIAVYCPAVKRPRSNVSWSNEAVVIGDPIEKYVPFVDEFKTKIKIKIFRLQRLQSGNKLPSSTADLRYHKLNTFGLT